MVRTENPFELLLPIEISDEATEVPVARDDHCPVVVRVLEAGRSSRSARNPPDHTGRRPRSFAAQRLVLASARRVPGHMKGRSSHGDDETNATSLR